MASMTVLPICPCLYRGFLWVWCHYDIIQGERNVQNCTTSYWSVSFTQMSHMTLLLFWLTVIGQEGHMTKFKSHCSLQLKCPHQVVLFDWYKGIPYYLIKCLCVKGLKCPLYYKNGIARGVNYHKNRGARGVPFMDNTPGDMDNIGKECRLPFIYTL